MSETIAYKYRLQKTLRKVVPGYAIFPLLLTGITNISAYFGAKLVQSIVHYDHMTDLTLEIDKIFPFTPAWSLIYVGTFLYWVWQYTTIAKESPEMVYRLAAADGFAKLICFVIFVLWPTTNVRPASPGDGFFGLVMRIIWWIDTPTNLFPSIHCMVAYIGTRYIYRCKHMKHRVGAYVFATVGTLLVFLSTLLTHQHVILDVVGGIATAEIGFLVARFTKLPDFIGRVSRRIHKTKLFQYL